MLKSIGPDLILPHSQSKGSAVKALHLFCGTQPGTGVISLWLWLWGHQRAFLRCGGGTRSLEGALTQC